MPAPYPPEKTSPIFEILSTEPLTTLAGHPKCPEDLVLRLPGLCFSLKVTKADLPIVESLFIKYLPTFNLALKKNKACEAVSCLPHMDYMQCDRFFLQLVEAAT